MKIDRDNLPSEQDFHGYQKRNVVRLAGPFLPPVEVQTADGLKRPRSPVYVGVGDDGNPYVLDAADVVADYTPTLLD